MTEIGLRANLSDPGSVSTSEPRTGGSVEAGVQSDAVALRPCRDCGVQPGEAHEDGCDVARCMLTGQQRIQHDCAGHCDTCTCVPCPPDIWTGEWPGVAECREFGWWCYFGPDYGQKGWIRCAADHPSAHPDLSRLVTEAVWDVDAKRWRKP